MAYAETHEAPLDRPTEQHVRPSTDRGPFGRLLEPGETVLWKKRPLPPSVAEALEEVAEGEVFEHKAMVDVAELDLSELLQSVSNPIALPFLTKDITSILVDFSTALGRRHLHAHLAVVADDKCRKFHTDHVTIRLLCTYAGPGTEWINGEDVVRKNLARTDVDLETANRSVLRVPDAVHHCGAGDILLLKGEAFEGNRGFGAVHRSPPVSSHATRRLLFKIDDQPCGC